MDAHKSCPTTTRRVSLLGRHINQIPTSQLCAGILGVILGLIIAMMIYTPLSLLPEPFGRFLPIVSAILFASLGIVVMTTRHADIAALIGQRLPVLGNEATDHFPTKKFLLLDTNVIIDGRIIGIIHAGFITDILLVPQFILNELKHVADSPDAQTRKNGRCGLDILEQLQQNPLVRVRIIDMDATRGGCSIDEKLVALAKQLLCPILTNDYNLGCIAKLQEVSVLNINELANAVKMVIQAGETLECSIIHKGDRSGQGVGYLDDGTMIVVENGQLNIGSITRVVATNVLQTSRGRMVFAKPEGSSR